MYFTKCCQSLRPPPPPSPLDTNQSAGTTLVLALCRELEKPPAVDGCPNVASAMPWGVQFQTVKELSAGSLTDASITDATRCCFCPHPYVALANSTPRPHATHPPYQHYLPCYHLRTTMLMYVPTFIICLCYPPTPTHTHMCISITI